MENNGGDLKKKLLDSLPDEMDEELFRKLQNDINKAVKEHERVSEDHDDAEFEYDRIMEEMSDVQMPPELEERLKRINEEYLAASEARAAAEEKERKRARRRKHMRSAAAVIAAFAVISGGILWKAPQAEAFRLKLYDTVFSPTDEDVGVEFVDTVYNNMPVIEDEELKAKANEIIERDGFILYPSVLPDGYELSEIKNPDDGKKIQIVFNNITLGNRMDFIYYPSAVIKEYNDSENSNNVNVLVNGQDAVVRSSDKASEIYWQNDNIYMKIIDFRQDADNTRLVKIADSVKKYNYINN